MLRDIITPQKALFIPGAHTELRAQLSRTRRVTSIMGNLVSNQRTDISGVSARVYKNGTYGFSSRAALTEEAARAVLTAASENAQFMDSHVARGKDPLPALPAETIHTVRDITDADQKLYIDFINELDAHIAKTYPNLASRTLVAFEDSMEKCLEGI